MRVINIVDRLDKVNFGIYNAAVFTATHLKSKFGVESEIWFPEIEFDPSDLNGCKPVPLKDTSSKGLKSILQNTKLNPKEDIIVSHGSWRYPTRWGNELKQRGFKWVYVPHGMLEPWSVQQKWLKKSAYLRWFEVPSARNADMVRAVGAPEQERLHQWFDNIVLIPNGIEPINNTSISNSDKCKVLFMGRLHLKKGVVPLIKAWQESELYANNSYELLIAGPDDGELPEIKKLLANKTENISYLGAVYGAPKEQLLTECSFYTLPSASEGFPTSVLEAMQYGLVPIITEGCNFPELFQAKIGFKTEQNVEKITATLNNLKLLDRNWIKEQSERAKNFVTERYSLEKIAEQQFSLYKKLLNK